MKKIAYLLLSLILFLTSCKTLSNTVTFPQKDGNLVFVTPADTKSKEVVFCSSDLTLFLTENRENMHSSLKYTFAIKEKSKSQLENLNVALVAGSTRINLNHNTLYVDKYKKNSLQIRFESELNNEQSQFLINTNDSLFFEVSDDSGFSSLIDLKDFKEKLNELRIYL